MVLLQDGLLAFFSAVGVTAVVWLIGGVLFPGRPDTAPGLLLVLPLQGDAPTLESDMRALRRLRGKIPGARIVLADRGLTAEGRSAAAVLVRRETDAALVDAQEFQLHGESIWKN